MHPDQTMDSQEQNTPEVSSHLQENTLLRFRVGPFRFAVPAVEVEGIIVPPALTRIPLNPPHSKGVFMHQQRLASAISLRSKFGLADSDDPNFGQLILGGVSVGLVAFWVDEVYETVDTGELEWREMPAFIPHAAFDSFAVKGDEVVLSTNLQQLYDVPAETAQQLLQSMRENFELPQDIPPVASEIPVNEDADVFGDLMSDQANENVVTGSDAGVSQPEEASQTPHAGETETGASKEAPAAKTNRAAAVSQRQVINFPNNRSAQNTNSQQARGSSVGTRRQQTSAGKQHSAARANTHYDRQSAVEARRVSANPDRHDSINSRDAHRGFVGGTHAGAVDQAHQYQHQHHDAQNGSSDYGKNDHGDTDRQQSSKGWLWLLLALILLALVAYLLWPGKKQGSISSIPTQNYQSNYSIRESIPAPVVREPRSSYEAVSPPPVATTRQDEIKPESDTVAASEPAAVKDKNEVYRLEGQDVTVTVERSQPSSEKVVPETRNDSPVSSEPVKPAQPGFDEFVHIVVKGDTLWDIAAKYLKNPFRYPELAQLSKISNPDLIYPGDTVRIRARKK